MTEIGRIWASGEPIVDALELQEWVFCGTITIRSLLLALKSLN